MMSRNVPAADVHGAPIAGNLHGLVWRQKMAADHYLATVRTRQAQDAVVIRGLSDTARAAVMAVEDAAHRARWGRGVLEQGIAEVGVAVELEGRIMHELLERHAKQRRLDPRQDRAPPWDWRVWPLSATSPG